MDIMGVNAGAGGDEEILLRQRPRQREMARRAIGAHAAAGLMLSNIQRVPMLVAAPSP